jgi:hypothetical protein
MYYTDSNDNQMKMKSAEKVKSNAKMQLFHNSGWPSTGGHDNKNIKLSASNLSMYLQGLGSSRAWP